MLRIITAIALLAVQASAATWIEYRHGLFRVYSDAGNRPSRERLTEMVQLQFVLGNMLGKIGPGKDGLDTTWPIHVVLFASTKEYGPHAQAAPFIDGGSATLSAWTADVPLPRDWLRALTRLLINENAGRMPESIETALCDLYSTIKVNGTHVSLGAPLPAGELPPDRLRAWAKVQMLATLPEYSGKFRVYLNNLQQNGDEGVATRNSFDLTIPKLNTLVDAYLKAGTFTDARVSGLALDANHDFPEKTTDPAIITGLLAELDAHGKTFPPESPRGLFAKGTRPSMELAAHANPKWAEPHAKIAALETSETGRVNELKLATKLDPRNAAYWQALAQAQILINAYADASKSWAAAEHNAVNEAERDKIHQARIDVDERRAEFEAAERKRIAEEQARDLQRVKDLAAAEVHAAEAATNKRLNQGKTPMAAKPQEWWEAPEGEKLEGTLTRVDCLNGPIRLTVQKQGAGPVRVVVRDSNKLTVQGANEAQFGCGIQKPARKIRIVYDKKPDTKLGTLGDVLVVEFP